MRRISMRSPASPRPVLPGGAQGVRIQSCTLQCVIRRARQDDVPAVLGLVVAAELFTASEAGLVGAMLADYFAGADADGHACVVEETEGELLSVAYYEPWRGTDRGWNLTMIAVRPDRQDRGLGSALINHVEDALRASGQRLLLVETSSLAPYDTARAFYAARGYDEVARVRDHWTDGDDMVLFRKALSNA